MSYCHLSTDDFRSDVYCYASDHGYVIHVADNRLVFNEETPPEIELTAENIDAWLERHNKVMSLVESGSRVNIALPHAGETFHEDTAADAAARLNELKI